MRSVPDCRRTRCRADSLDRSIAFESCPISLLFPFRAALTLRIDLGPVGLHTLISFGSWCVNLESELSTCSDRLERHQYPLPYPRLS